MNLPRTPSYREAVELLAGIEDVCSRGDARRLESVRLVAGLFGVTPERVARSLVGVWGEPPEGE